MKLSHIHSTHPLPDLKSSQMDPEKRIVSMMNWLLISRVLIATLLLLHAASFSRPLAAAEPQPQGTYQEIDVGPNVTRLPAVSPDGTVYLTFRSGGRRLAAAYSRTGELLWEFTIEGQWKLPSAPVIDHSGRIYFGGGTRKLFALNPDGKSRWELSLPSDLVGSIAITGDGVLVFATQDGFMNAVLDGKWIWRTRADATKDSAPAIAADGTIYFLNRRLAKISPNGTVGQDLAVSCSNFTLASDGTIYIRALQPWSIAKFDPATGSVLWNFVEPIHPAAVVGPDGKIYSAAGQRLFQVNTDGTLAAEHDVQRNVHFLWPLTLAADGTLFATSSVRLEQGSQAVMFKVAPDFASHQEFHLGPGHLSPVVLGQDGTAYLIHTEGKLFIIPGDSPLPDKGWPSVRFDAGHTANLSSLSPTPGNSRQLDRHRRKTCRNGPHIVG